MVLRDLHELDVSQIEPEGHGTHSICVHARLHVLKLVKNAMPDASGSALQPNPIASARVPYPPYPLRLTHSCPRDEVLQMGVRQLVSTVTG